MALEFDDEDVWSGSLEELRESLNRNWKNLASAKEHLPQIKKMLEDARNNRRKPEFAYYFILNLVIENVELYQVDLFDGATVELVCEMPLQPDSDEELYRCLSRLYRVQCKNTSLIRSPYSKYTIQDLIGEGMHDLKFFMIGGCSKKE